MQTQLLYVSAGITVFIAATHSYLGEKRILPRLIAGAATLFQRDPALMGSILRWAWHLTSLAWVALALLLIAFTRMPADVRAVPVAIIAACLGLNAVVCFVTTRGKHVAWPFFLAASATAVLGALGHP
jgi:hypothetical protein